MKTTLSKSTCVILFASMVLASPALGKSMRDSVNQAVLSHPDVQAAWHAFRASDEEQEAARGGYRPRMDLSAMAPS